jgi:hypothetical protein
MVSFKIIHFIQITFSAFMLFFWAKKIPGVILHFKLLVISNFDYLLISKN